MFVIFGVKLMIYFEGPSKKRRLKGCFFLAEKDLRILGVLVCSALICSHVLTLIHYMYMEVDFTLGLQDYVH